MKGMRARNARAEYNLAARVIDAIAGEVQGVEV
jgi:hypothetical protein